MWLETLQPPLVCVPNNLISATFHTHPLFKPYAPATPQIPSCSVQLHRSTSCAPQNPQLFYVSQLIHVTLLFHVPAVPVSIL